MNILIAEDDTTLSAGLASCLVRAGYSVEQAFDGEAALRALDEARFDLLVLDHGLPKVHGTQVLRVLRERDKHLPVLLISALNDADSRVQALGLSVDSFLAKPFGLDEFESRVDRLARQSHTAAHKATSFGPIRFDPKGSGVQLNGTVLELPADERAVLELLAQRGGASVSVDEMTQRLRASCRDHAPDAVEGCVQRLRARLSAQAVQIVRLRGLGYCLAKT